MKQRWIEEIQSANNDNYSGGGFVCEQHFLPDNIIKTTDRKQLTKGSVPSVFLVEILEINESDESDESIDSKAENRCGRCECLEAQLKDLSDQFTKFRLDSDIQRQKLQQDIEKKMLVIIEKSKEIKKLKANTPKEIETLKKLNDKLREQLLISRTTPSLNVSILIHSYFFQFDVV